MSFTLSCYSPQSFTLSCYSPVIHIILLQPPVTHNKAQLVEVKELGQHGRDVALMALQHLSQGGRCSLPDDVHIMVNVLNNGCVQLLMGLLDVQVFLKAGAQTEGR